jgi:hypothetical protein
MSGMIVQNMSCIHYAKRLIFDVKYHCPTVWTGSFTEYLSPIFTILKITYLDIDCSRVSLFACIKHIHHLSEPNSLKLSFFPLQEAERLLVKKIETY